MSAATILAVVVAALLAGIGWLVRVIFNQIKGDISEIRKTISQMAETITELIVSDRVAAEVQIRLGQKSNTPSML